MRHLSDAISEADLIDARASDVEPSADPTHYVTAATAERSAAYNRHGKASRRLQAACGAWVNYPREHAAEPTCDQCLAFLEQEAAADADISAALEGDLS